MKRLLIAYAIILFGGCTSNERAYTIILAELESSQYNYQERTMNSMNCIRIIFERQQASSDTLKRSVKFSDLYYRLNKLHIFKDSLINEISENSKEKELIDLLVVFRQEILQVHKGDYRPDKYLEPNIKIEIDFLRKDLHDLPDYLYPQLFKCIIERWTYESFVSLLNHWAIDDPC